MIDLLFVVGFFAVSICVGLGPAILSRWLSLRARWTLAGALFLGSLWFNQQMSGAPHRFDLYLVLMPFWVGLAIAVLWILTGRKSSAP